jgi:hypothetical protein
VQFHYKVTIEKVKEIVYNLCLAIPIKSPVNQIRKRKVMSLLVNFIPARGKDIGSAFAMTYTFT